MTNSDPDSAQPGDEYEEHGHTLSALQGRGLRRELSTMALRGVDGFDGEDALDAGGVSPGSTPISSPAQTPSTTLTGAEQASLAGALHRTQPVTSRRESMPPSSGHARLDGLFPTEPAHIPSIAEEKAWKNQLAASDDEDEPADPTQVSVSTDAAPPKTFKSNAPSKAPPNPLEAMLAGTASTGRGGKSARRSVDIRRDMPSRNGNQLAGTFARKRPGAGAAPSPDAAATTDAPCSTGAPRFVRVTSRALSSRGAQRRDGGREAAQGGPVAHQGERAHRYKRSLIARKQSALAKVSRMTLLREAAHDVKKAAHLPNLPNLPRMSMGMGRMSFGPSAILASLPPKIDEDDSTEKTPRERSFKEHCVRAGIVGFVLLILCCIPHIMHQYEPTPRSPQPQAHTSSPEWRRSRCR